VICPPFELAKHRQMAVRIVGDPGIESLRILRVP